MPELVTDPELLSQLNGGPQEVTDPDILRQLNEPERGPGPAFPSLSDFWNSASIPRQGRAEQRHTAS